MNIAKDGKQLSSFQNIINEKKYTLQKLLEKYKKYSSVEIITRVRNEIIFLEQFVKTENDLIIFYLYKQMNMLRDKLNTSDPNIITQLLIVQQKYDQYKIDREYIEHAINIKKTMNILKQSGNNDINDKLEKEFMRYCLVHNLQRYMSLESLS